MSPPLDKRGFAIFFTGLSGSGKTTITSALIEALQSLLPTRRMTILDGDVVRTHLSKELGFSIKVWHTVRVHCRDLVYLLSIYLDAFLLPGSQHQCGSHGLGRR